MTLPFLVLVVCHYCTLDRVTHFVGLSQLKQWDVRGVFVATVYVTFI